MYSTLTYYIIIAMQEGLYAFRFFIKTEANINAEQKIKLSYVTLCSKISGSRVGKSKLIYYLASHSVYTKTPLLKYRVVYRMSKREGGHIVLQRPKVFMGSNRVL